jgi:hypothetical protein
VRRPVPRLVPPVTYLSETFIEAVNYCTIFFTRWPPRASLRGSSSIPGSRNPGIEIEFDPGILDPGIEGIIFKVFGEVVCSNVLGSRTYHTRFASRIPRIEFDPSIPEYPIRPIPHGV